MSIFRKAYLLPALEAGLIEMTIPEKARSSQEKYRLTDKGRENGCHKLMGGASWRLKRPPFGFCSRQGERCKLDLLEMDEGALVTGEEK